mmetsp:Transcript_63960/g.128547  ORF Transcript_63960/g.128547 Transcript_63960/m.128547 type:complete len:92 (+) Transcript_63960:103-378(+)
MMQERNIVALPFRVAAGFLLLLFLWGFGSEEASMSNPSKYEFEHFKKPGDNRTEVIEADKRGWKSGGVANIDLNIWTRSSVKEKKLEWICT